MQLARAVPCKIRNYLAGQWPQKYINCFPNNAETIIKYTGDISIIIQEVEAICMISQSEVFMRA